MPEVEKTRKRITLSTQQYLDIVEIKDNYVVLKDGTLRAVLLVSSINFDLKSEDEQNAIVQGYTQLLNSFEFPVQIVIQSRRLDIDKYLEKLRLVVKEQINELLKMQTSEYLEYIQELVKMADIMSKHFYVVVPYSPLSDKRKGFFSRFKETIYPTQAIKIKAKKLERYKRELFRRADFISDGLTSLGLQAVRLDTQSLIELYYNTYNPQISNQEKLAQVDKLDIETETKLK